MHGETARILVALRAREPALKAMGVERVALFGSVARGEAGPESDLDVAVTFDRTRAGTGFAYFGHLDSLRSYLERELGRSVDLVAEPVRRPELRRAVDRDRLVAFG